MHSKVILHGLRCWEESMTCNVSQEIMKGTHQVVFAEFPFPSPSYCLLQRMRVTMVHMLAIKENLLFSVNGKETFNLNEYFGKK